MNITLGGSRGESGDSVKPLKLKNRHIYNMLTIHQLSLFYSEATCLVGKMRKTTLEWYKLRLI